MSLTRNKMSNFPFDSGRSFDSTRRVSVKSYGNETLVKPVSHQPCGSRAPVYEHIFGVFLAAASRPSYVSQGRKAVATSYGEFSTCSFSLRFSADVWRSQGSCKAASR